MRIIPTTGAVTQKTLNAVTRVLHKGGVCVVPSDTVYGLLCDATNSVAVDRLLRFKDRPVGKPISVFVDGMEKAKKYAHMSAENEQIIRRLAPGPFTFVLGSARGVDERLISETKTLGIRLPDNELIQRLTHAYPHPITATSANITGKGPHYDIRSLLHTLSARKTDLIDLIIDAGVLPKKKPSTVIDLTGERLSLLRRGDITDVIASERSQTYFSSSSTDTKNVAKKIVKSILKKYPDTPVSILLEGPMGAGKTVFISGLASVLGVKNIVSPTYAIYYEYSLPKGASFENLYHADLFRLEDISEFEDLGFEKMFETKALVCIEWAQKSQHIMSMLQKFSAIVSVRMDYKGSSKREIAVTYGAPL